MEFFATDCEYECRVKVYPPSENRVWGFSASSRPRARRFASQVVEPQQEKQPTPTATASGVPYYGYRYYSPELGRFVNRDMLGEMGGVNVYAFVENSVIMRVDLYGLASWEPTCDASTVGEKYLSSVGHMYFTYYGAMGSLADAEMFTEIWGIASDLSDVGSLLTSMTLSEVALILLNNGVSSAIVNQLQQLFQQIRDTHPLNLKIDYKCKECKCKKRLFSDGLVYGFEQESTTRTYTCMSPQGNDFWYFPDVTYDDLAKCQADMAADMTLCDD